MTDADIIQWAFEHDVLIAHLDPEDRQVRTLFKDPRTAVFDRPPRVAYEVVEHAGDQTTVRCWRRLHDTLPRLRELHAQHMKRIDILSEAFPAPTKETTHEPA